MFWKVAEVLKPGYRGKELEEQEVNIGEPMLDLSWELRCWGLTEHRSRQLRLGVVFICFLLL